MSDQEYRSNPYCPLQESACPDPELWYAYADGTLDAQHKERLDALLERCDRCFAACTAASQTMDSSKHNTPPSLLAKAQRLPLEVKTKSRRPYYYAAAVLLIAAISWWSTLDRDPAALPDDVPLFSEAPPPEAELGYARIRKSLASTGQINVLTIFAQFNDESRPVPAFIDELFDPDLPGSLTHYYHTMSFGQLRLQGTVLPDRYTAARGASAYLARQYGDYGYYGEFGLEILEQVDAQIDLGLFDNDGPDGKPNSGDDDGMVDYVFLCVSSTPENFILKGATGIAGLGFEDDYRSNDTTPDGTPIRVSGYRSSGTILREGSLAATVGTMAHEFGHSIGLIDLYDQDYTNPAEDSGGIGRWGLMGWGASGWNNNDGPNPLSPPHLEYLEWITPENGRLVDITDDATDLEIADLYDSGVVYRVPLKSYVMDGGVLEEEFLLIEYRRRDSHFYNRNQHGEGLLVWHVRPHAHLVNFQPGNAFEERKLIDLVCADGLFRDKGYPLGRIADPLNGGDNLDFWAHDEAYRRTHAGNLGDATDLFDGEQFTRLRLPVDPEYPDRVLLIDQIRRQGNRMRFNIRLPRWAGVLHGNVHWVGDVLVDGDLTVAPDARLTIHDHTRIRFTPTDRLAAGNDPQRCEIHIQGRLEINTDRLSRIDKKGRQRRIQTSGITFASSTPEGTWSGIFPDPSAWVGLNADQITILNAQYGLWDPNAAPPLSQPLTEVATAVDQENAVQPTAFSLEQNFPNPFNSQTQIRYSLPEATQVRLQIFNSSGQTVHTLEDGFQAAGSYQLEWDGQDANGQTVASGVYIYRLEITGGQTLSRRMTLVK